MAGPRFAIRNAIEDDIFYLARGRNPWDMVKGRLWSTRIRTGKGVGAEDTALEKFKSTVWSTKPGELGAINKFVKADEVAEFSAKIAAATNENEVRAVMAEAVLRNKLAYKLDKKSAKIVEELVRYGNLDDLLADVSEGAKNGVRGGGRYSNIADDVNRYGKMEAITIDGKAYKRSVGDKAFTNYNPVANEQAKVGWLFQISVMANDELGSIAVRYMKDENKAIAEMKKYLSTLPKRDRDRFQLYFKDGGNIDTHAQRAYIAARNVFSKKNGDLNEDLLNAVVKVNKDGTVKVSAKELRLADLPNDPKLAPEYISGPTLVPVSEGDNFAASFFDKGWDAMGEANARWSREPIVLNEVIRFRKELDDAGYTQKVINDFTKGKTGEAYNKAYKSAMRRVNDTAEDLAKDSALAYVDNPAVRSQLAMSSRNFARFYRATEDFYRRFYRTTRY